jgi:ATP-binding cassette subfamily F protein 3
LAKLEKELDGLNAERVELDNWLADEAAYKEENKTLLQEKLKRQGEVKQRLEDIEWQWFEVQQKLEDVAA